MELQYKNSELELLSFYKYKKNNEIILKRYRYFKTLIMIPISIIIAIFVYLIRLPLIRIYSEVMPEDVLLISAPIIIGIILCIIYHFILNILERDEFDEMIKNMGVNFDEDIILRVTENGLEYLKQGSIAIYYWNAIKEVIEEKNLFYVLLNNGSGIVIPISAFKEEKDKKVFIEKIDGFK